VTANPYPGLRPFERDDAHLFFGREKQVAELVELLERHRFIAVVGVSGSGKSSLVKAGLLPALHLGAMGDDFPEWRVAVMTPAADPIGELCRKLNGEQALGPAPDCRDLLESTSRGLIERALRAGLEDGAHLLIVVDQFEEIFRYRKERAEGADRAARFVRMLLEATEEQAQWARIFVLLTMRSDYLGECAEFNGLPEALNRCQYLVPRMTRDERRAAIEKPARAAGIGIEAGLVDQLLNFVTRPADGASGLPQTEAGDEAGQLPVLQHVLRRTFAEFRKEPGDGKEVKLVHYDRTGKLEDALNRHADSLLDSPADPDGGWTARVFRCLTTVDGGPRVRRPTPLGLLYKVVGATDDTKKDLVGKVLKAYTDTDCSMLSLKGPNQAGEMIADISHESLISRWTSLGRWVDAEAEAVRVYRAAADDVSHFAGAGAQWRGTKLDTALAYLDPDRGVWNKAWASRIQKTASYPQVCDFLNGQKAEQTKEEKAREAQSIRENRLYAAIIVLLVAALAGGYFWAVQRSRADQMEVQQQTSTARLLGLTADADRQRLEYAQKIQALEQRIASAGASGGSHILQTELNNLRNSDAHLPRVNPKDGLTDVWIPAGSFTMGCSSGDTECEESEKPPHTVTIANGFWLSQTDVTQAAWNKVKVAPNPSHFNGDQLPVESVAWNDAKNYCTAVGGRLPSEKEWEYAARAGTAGARYGAIAEIAWYSDNSGGTPHPVGLKKANAFGLYDMLGDVYQWTADDWAPYPGGKVDDCKGCKILRGGSWYSSTRFVRASFRNRVGPAYRDIDIGFRCVGEFR
jgi:formylglycine-generating enzyme required for sulfatase activity